MENIEIGFNSFFGEVIDGIVGVRGVIDSVGVLD